MTNPSFGHGSDVGLLRDHNEDSYAVRPDIGLWLVADGMGGHQCGDVASDLVSRLVPERVAAGEELASAIANVHKDLHRAISEGVGGSDMGSTVVALQLSGAGSYRISWVGDSRAYLWDGLELRRLTRDHSLIQRMLDSGTITEEESRTHPQRSLISQALGSSELSGVEVETVTGVICQGCRLLLCSDGLTSDVEDAEISEILKSGGDDQTLVDRLIAAAKRNGGSDNITAILISAPDDAPARTSKGGTTRVDSAALNRILQNDAAVRKKRSLLLKPLIAILVIISLWFVFRFTGPEPGGDAPLPASPHEGETIENGRPDIQGVVPLTEPGLLPGVTPAPPLHSVDRTDPSPSLPAMETTPRDLPRIGDESHPGESTDDISKIIDTPEPSMSESGREDRLSPEEGDDLSQEEMMPSNQKQE